MSVQSEKIAKYRTFEFKKKTNKDIEIFCLGTQGSGKMHSQKNFRALRAVGIPKWQEHIHASAKTFLY